VKRALPLPRRPTYRARAQRNPEEGQVSTGEWLVLALACSAGIAGLLLAASGGEGTIYVLGLGLFAGAVIYAGRFIKQHFDRLDGMRH
jgi:hypothetical protein